MSTLELLEFCKVEVVDIPEGENNKQFQFPYMEKKDLRRIQVRFGSVPGRIWKIFGYKTLGRRVSDKDIQLTSISIQAIPSKTQKDEVDTRDIVIKQQNLVAEGCLWINKSCLRFTYLDHNSKAQKVDFHHNEKGQIRQIYVF